MVQEGALEMDLTLSKRDQASKFTRSTGASDLLLRVDKGDGIETGLPFIAEEDEQQATLKVSNFVRRLSLYNPMPRGNSDAEEKKESNEPVKMGTLMGVFMPCIQNIFGVLFFIRLAWMVGTAGVVEAFCITLICCLVTLSTSISLSAIATNGMVPAGGPYYMISRNLGPELGGAVGILFYLASTIAASMYLLGSAEIFLLYLLPQAKMFNDIYNCYRLIGTILLVIVSCIVLSGVGVVNKFALPTIALVNFCIMLTFVGFFVNFNGSDNLKFCTVGDRVPDLQKWIDRHPDHHLACNGTDLRLLFCSNVSVDSTCDPYFLKAAANDKIQMRRAIEGVSSGVIKANLFQKYLNTGDMITQMEDDKALSNVTSLEEKGSADAENWSSGFVVADMATSFTIFIGIFFPSVTGIMQGSNRSGNLKDASRSIPIGTIAATLITSTCYLMGVLCFGAAINDLFLRDKFGAGAYGRLAVAELAVPHPMVIIVGSFIASAGAGMQCLTGAPRLLQAIASDGVIPILGYFQKTTKGGEPVAAIIVSIIICELCILIAFLESITALISQFFLMCYLSVNAVCALQSILKAPSWRPRFRFYHWSFSMFGAALCIAVMFMSHWMFAIVSIMIGVIAYKYIEYRGAEKEWGDGIRGLRLSAASYALTSLEEGPVHTKNWRPQILVLCAPSKNSMKIRDEKLVAFASQLKAGKGLTVLATVVPGRFVSMEHETNKNKQILKEVRSRMKIRGFYEVLVSRDVVEGISALVQTSGLGGMHHNTVIIGWPSNWKDSVGKATKYIEIIRLTEVAKKALIVLKNAECFPDNSEKMTGTIDIWWILHDGGIMVLLAFLLKQNRVWRQTKFRIFTVTHRDEADVSTLRESLRKFIYHLRIDAFADVVELSEHDIVEYAHELTLKQEEREKMLVQLSLTEKEKEVTNIQHAISNRKRSRACNDRFPDSPNEILRKDSTTDNCKVESNVGVDELKLTNRYNVRCIQRATKLNEVIHSRSASAQLVCLNLPAPRIKGSDVFYMEYIETLTKDLNRVVLVKGSGREVVTIYS